MLFQNDTVDSGGSGWGGGGDGSNCCEYEKKDIDFLKNTHL